jgi:hypothetical protein
VPATRDELTAWRDQLAQIIATVADLLRALGISRDAGGLSAPVESAGADHVEAALDELKARVRRANAAAERLLAADPSLAEIAHPLLGVPGDKPVVDLRPWWSKLLQIFSSTAQRASIAESLETLRLEVRQHAREHHVEDPVRHSDALVSAIRVTGRACV